MMSSSDLTLTQEARALAVKVDKTIKGQSMAVKTLAAGPLELSRSMSLLIVKMAEKLEGVESDSVK